MPPGHMDISLLELTRFSQQLIIGATSKCCNREKTLLQLRYSPVEGTECSLAVALRGHPSQKFEKTEKNSNFQFLFKSEEEYPIFQLKKNFQNKHM